jgi:Chlamydia polymorphic membrane protein (Chlamydia_PMP).
MATQSTNGDLAAGGAIYGYMKTTSQIIKLTLSNVLFEDNTALEGGAVYIRGRSSTAICQVNVDNCTFINNKASNGAGAIYVYNNDLSVNNCNFINNSALRTNESGRSGGAIFNYGILNVNNSLFENNAALFGGAIVNDEKTAVINNSKFIANIATTNSGSAISNYNSFATLTVDNCTFSYNVANTKGSVIYNYWGNS